MAARCGSGARHLGHHGLAGSGSHDFAIDGAVVPPERTFDLVAGAALNPLPLYRLKWMFFINLAAVPLGLGRADIDEATSTASTKLAAGSFTPACEDPLVQVAGGACRDARRSARSYLLDTVDAVWQAVLADRDTSGPWVRFRLANTNAFHSVKEAVGTLYEALGTTGVYRRSPLDRHYRDIATMASTCWPRRRRRCHRAGAPRPRPAVLHRVLSGRRARSSREATRHTGSAGDEPRPVDERARQG